MVEWKGNLSEEAGGKALRLDRLEDFNVPNFFVITESEIKEFVGDAKNTEELMQKESSEFKKKVDAAYKEIGMSSEVRNASGPARDLVGGQRESQRVSIRISTDGRGSYDFKLNVGSSSLLEAIKNVLVSYYEEEGSGYPSIIVQKMVEPEYTGAAIQNYMGDYGIIESVEGLGISIEKGVTAPDLYLLRDGEVKDMRIPEEQIRITRNPINGDNRRKKLSERNQPFQKDEAEKFFRKLSSQPFSLKFVYKRGTFYIVNAFENSSSTYSEEQPDLAGLRVSPGTIEGVTGEDVAFSDDTLPPEEYSEALIASRGGYTSTHAQQARKAGKPAVFSFNGSISNGSRISIPEDSTVPEENADQGASKAMQRESSTATTNSMTASEVLPIDRGNPCVRLSPPFHNQGFAVTDRNTEADRINRENYLTSYGKVFEFEGDKLVLDARTLNKPGLENAMEYLEADLKILLFDRPDPEIIRKGIEQGFKVFGANPQFVEETEKVVAREEKRFMLEKLRDL